MNTITKQLTRQATRTVANKTLRKASKDLPIHPMIKHVGLAAILAGISYIISKKL